MYDGLTREVEQFLYREARLLDERRPREWLALFTNDARYWMGGRSNRYPKTSKAIAIFDPERYLEDDLTQGGELAILDETKETLARRVARLETGMTWAEDPPSRTRHLIANLDQKRRGGIGAQGLLQFHRLLQPGGNRAGFLCRCATRRPATGRRRIEDHKPQAHPQPERAVGQERQHLLLIPENASDHR
jgi:3-phenylpropionate/cinnamic acid dioxygenase small subunit